MPRHRASGPRQVLAGMWCSTMCARDNGPLRVIPGSHCGDRDLAEGMPFGSRAVLSSVCSIGSGSPPSAGHTRGS